MLEHLLAIPILILALLRQVALWQRKEYRLDRLLSPLKGGEIHSTIKPIHLSIYSAITLAWLSYIIYPHNLVTPTLGWMALLAIIILFINDVLRRGLTRPTWTTRAALTTILTTILIFIYIFYLYNQLILTALQWSTLTFFIPGLVGLSSAAISLGAYVQKKRIITEAKILRKKRRLQVIGITGSFGKTSTKHFLYQILDTTGQNVVATANHKNSEFTVAQDMLTQLASPRDIYIAEMGAYRKGEITALANLTQPQIGVITAIQNQHLALFGSLAKVQQAKSELIAALPSSGFAILNADDENVVEVAQATSAQIIWYSIQKPTNIYLSDVVYLTQSTKFNLHIGRSSLPVTTPIISAGLIKSLAAAMAAAHTTGMSIKDIASALSSLKPFPQTMTIQTGLNKCTIINDSYSASQGAVENALEHVQRFQKQDKRIVFTPIIELGSAGHAVHRQLGQLLGDISATIHISNHLYKSAIEDGYQASNKQSKIIWYEHPLALAEAVSAGLTSKSLVLLEGRLPDVVHKALNLS